ncbi:MAG: hypothetical protein H0W73_19565 [Bacteroidetes bacterium]|nr:hypothetical protein [Bacteroidota bacterium]
MKKITLGFSILVASAIFIAGCNKKVTEAPVADMEFDSAIEASFATSAISDIDMICGFLGENAYPKFVSPAANSTGTMTVINNTLAPQSAQITWSNVICADGKTRNGRIVMTYSFTDINSNYYRDYGFNGNLQLIDYTVDGWSIDDSVSLNAGMTRIKNLAPSANPNPATTKLKWSVDGYFKIVNVADPTKRIDWVGTLYKTLQNTAQLAPTALTAVTWSAAIVEYDGTFRGTTIGNVPFTYSVSTEKPLVRDYRCSPDKAIGITTTPSVAIVNSEFHPIINGVASFTTGTSKDKEPRVIDYGTEGAPCDNSGTIYIKGISYKVDFKK